MSEKLQKLLERLATDEELRKKVMKDKQALAEMEWSPEEIASFCLKDESRYWGCGTQCGCSASMGQGCGPKVGHACSGGSGAKIKGC